MLVMEDGVKTALHRYQYHPLNELVCESHSYWVRPGAGTNNLVMILFILNNNKNGIDTRQEYVQEVEVGDCAKIGSICGDGSL